MGIDYGFEMWVPYESLYDFMACVAKRCPSYELYNLVWPDSRRLVPPPSVDQKLINTHDLIPFDGSFDESICLSFAFPEDDALIRYDQEQLQHALQHNQRQHSVKNEDGLYQIGCIWTNLYLEARWFNWLEEEPFYIQVSFTAAITRMSLLFAESHSVRSFFIELAKEGGAVSCVLYKEGFGDELVYLEGKEYAMIGTLGSAHPRELRRMAENATPSDATRLHLNCQYTAPINKTELTKLIDLTHDADSGIRALACRQLRSSNSNLVAPTIVQRLSDVDWRVRAVAAESLANIKAPNITRALLAALQDEHSEVRIAAANALLSSQSKEAYLALLEVIETPNFQQPHLGLLLEVIREILRYDNKRDSVKAIKTLLTHQDFPLRRRAEEILERLNQPH